MYKNKNKQNEAHTTGFFVVRSDFGAATYLALPVLLRGMGSSCSSPGSTPTMLSPSKGLSRDAPDEPSWTASNAIMESRAISNCGTMALGQ